MLKIRLQRSGRKNRPNYRIVVAEHSAPIKGRYVEMLGTFDPLVEKHGLVIDTAKVEAWIKKGAKPTDTVARLLKGKGEKGMESFIVEMKDRAVKNPKEVKEPATPAPVAEAPVVEEKAEEMPVEVVEVPAEEVEVEAEEEKPVVEAPVVEEKAEEMPVEAPAEEVKVEAEEEKPAEEVPVAEEEKSEEETK